MRKPFFCICENKAQPLAIFCNSTAQFVSKQVRNPEDRFSHSEAPVMLSEVFDELWLTVLIITVMRLLHCSITVIRLILMFL